MKLFCQLDKLLIEYRLISNYMMLNYTCNYYMSAFKGKKVEVMALGTFVKLMRASESVSSDVHRYLADRGLTISQFGILEALYHLGPMCQRDLAEKILKSTGNITTVIDNLEKQNLVVRERSSEDRRYYIIRLRDKGRELIAGIFPDHVEKIRKRMSHLTIKEQQILSKLLKKLGQHQKGR